MSSYKHVYGINSGTFTSLELLRLLWFVSCSDVIGAFIKCLCCRLEHFGVAMFNSFPFAAALSDFLPNPMVAFESWLQMHNQCHWSSSALSCLKEQKPLLISTSQRAAKMLSSVWRVGKCSGWNCLQSFVFYREKSSVENLSHMAS